MSEHTKKGHAHTKPAHESDHVLDAATIATQGVQQHAPTVRVTIAGEPWDVRATPPLTMADILAIGGFGADHYVTVTTRDAAQGFHPAAEEFRAHDAPVNLLDGDVVAVHRR